MVEGRTGGMTEAELGQAVSEGFGHLKARRLADAHRLADSLLFDHGQHPHVLYFAAEVRAADGEAEAAYGLFAKAAEQDPGQFALLIRKAQMLVILRRRTEAKAAAREAAAAANGDARALYTAAQVFSQCDDPAGAVPYYQAALKASPGSRAVLFELATAQFFTGDTAGAEASLAPLLAEMPGGGQALYLRSVLRRQSAEQNHITDLESRLGMTSGEDRVGCLYALAKEYEDLGQSEKSFAALKAGAKLKRSLMRYDGADECAAIDTIGKAYTADVMNAPTEGCGEEGAIFIVGMPRTGTTLVERILGRHSRVTPVGELQDFAGLLADAARQVMAQSGDAGLSLVEASLRMDFEALGRAYMKAARDAAGGAPVFVDKMPVNFIYAGIIRKALPNARILHLTRDPMDACFAVYKTLFNRAYSFSYDFDDLARYYASYHTLMQHWHAVMPGAVLDVAYEDLVQSPDAEARRLLAFCGLDWQDQVLDPKADSGVSTSMSSAQVREAVHTRSVGRWRTHEAELQPLRDKLVAAGIPLGE